MSEQGNQIQSNNKVELRNRYLDQTEGKDIAVGLNSLLERYKDKRVLVLGVSCIGKSTLLQHIPGIDMDIIFDTMSAEFRQKNLQGEPYEVEMDGKRIIKYRERHFVEGDPQSEELLRHTGEVIAEYASRNLPITPGVPVFGICLIEEVDVVIHLNPTSSALDQRIESRNSKTNRRVHRERVYAMRKLVEEDVEKARQKGVTIEEFPIN